MLIASKKDHDHTYLVIGWTHDELDILKSRNMPGIFRLETAFPGGVPVFDSVLIFSGENEQQMSDTLLKVGVLDTTNMN